MIKKILIVTEYFYPEEFKINDLALKWVEQGHQVHVLTQNPTYPFGKIFPDHNNSWFSIDHYQGITVYRVKAITGYKTNVLKKILKYFTFMVLGSFFALKHGKQYDYVFGFDIGALTGMVPAVLIQKIHKIPVTLWIQDIWPDSVYAYGFKKTTINQKILDSFVRFVYRNSTAFAISSKSFESKIQPYLNKKIPMLFAPNWADPIDITLPPVQFSSDSKIHFTFAGNIGKMQNLDNIVDAYLSLRADELQKSQLNFIGDGSYLEELKNRIPEHKKDCILFHGRKPREIISQYLLGSDFLIVSLKKDPIFALTIPGKLQTYIAVQKPILGIIEGEAAQIIKEYELGLTADPDDKEKIKELFSKAISMDQIEKEAFTQNSYALTNTLFSKDMIIDSLFSHMVKDT